MGKGDANAQPPEGALSTDNQEPLAKRENPSSKLLAVMTSKREAIDKLCTRYVSSDKLLAQFGTAMTRNPKIATCTPISVFESLMLAAQTGLDCSGGTRGEAYLVPYKNKEKGVVECSFMPGYKGLIKIALRDPSIKMVYAHVVYEDDEFECQIGTGGSVTHKPTDRVREPSRIRGAYSFATTDDGLNYVEYMSRDELDRVERASKASGPRRAWPDQMHRKAPIRRLAKFIPLVDEVAEQFGAATQHEDIGFDTAPAMNAGGGVAALKDRLKGQETSDDDGND